MLPNTTYYIRAFAVNEEGIGYGNEVVYRNCSNIPIEGSFVDPRDGIEYKTVTLCNQTWMAENLRYNAAGSQSNPNNPSIEYGRLYDYNTAMTACPSGWHLPTNNEWFNLESVLGLINWGYGGWRGTHGVAMKSETGWIASGNGTNSSRLNMLPAGSFYNGIFNSLGSDTYFWSSSSSINNAEARCLVLSYSESGASHYDTNKNAVISCRCLKD
jgi:uncharacterized protein (TIGR02145 family)